MALSIAAWHRENSLIKYRVDAMNVTIDLSDRIAAALEAQARAAHMPAERYLADIVSRALEAQHRQDVQNLEAHLDHMASQVVPETTPEEMEGALREALSHVRQRRNWQP
jgi:hypothetical protein